MHCFLLSDQNRNKILNVFEDSFLTDGDYLTLESDQSNNASNNNCVFIANISTLWVHIAKEYTFTWTQYISILTSFHHNLETYIYIYIEKYSDGRQLFNGWIGTLRYITMIHNYILYHKGVFLLQNK